jgi:hypothetical protein
MQHQEKVLKGMEGAAGRSKFDGPRARSAFFTRRAFLEHQLFLFLLLLFYSKNPKCHQITLS